MTGQTIILRGQAQRNLAHMLVDNAPDGYTVLVKETTRTDAQNNKIWPMLKDVSDQVDWYGRKLKPHEWKDVFTASLRNQDVVPGLDGNFVVLGLRTSTMGKKEFADLVTLIYAFGDQRGVQWSEPNPYEVTQ